MKRLLTLGAVALVVALGLVSAAEAQVFVRAPFVRVQVGGGVWVRAPFVNFWVPPGPSYYAGPGVYFPPPGVYAPAPRVADSPPPQSFDPPPPQPAPPQQPLPQQQPVPNNDNTPPQPTKAVKVLTLEQFASSFQPKGGNYEVSIVNPVTNQPSQVRFTLPEGSPRRVQVLPNGIEFVYGIRRFVRIEFDNEGAMVTSR
jgi:hypothetical protein